jgi:hypothetical protein
MFHAAAKVLIVQRDKSAFRGIHTLGGLSIVEPLHPTRAALSQPGLRSLMVEDHDPTCGSGVNSPGGRVQSSAPTVTMFQGPTRPRM